MEAFGARLGLSRSKVCDYEHGRRPVTYARAAEWARVLGYEPADFVQALAQEQLAEAGLRLRVQVVPG